MKALGIILIVAGALALAYQGFSFVTQEKVVDAGPIEVTAERNRYVYLPPLVGAVILGAGVLFVATSGRKTAP